jgi:hypothetical protein
MRLIVIGCEHTGKTTLVYGLQKWIMDTMGDGVVMVHDHFLPSIGEGAPERYTAEVEEEQFFNLKPFALEKYMRYMIHYHLGHHFYLENDHLLVNWYYGDAVYAPLYFGYGGPDAYADRQRLARHYDSEVMSVAPDTVLLHLAASPEVIRERLRAEPGLNGRFQERDIELVLARFNDEFASSLIRRKLTLDTSQATPDQTLRAFLNQMASFWTSADRLRMLSRGEQQPRG